MGDQAGISSDEGFLFLFCSFLLSSLLSLSHPAFSFLEGGGGNIEESACGRVSVWASVCEWCECFSCCCLLPLFRWSAPFPDPRSPIPTLYYVFCMAGAPFAPGWRCWFWRETRFARCRVGFPPKPPAHLALTISLFFCLAIGLLRLLFALRSFAVRGGWAHDFFFRKWRRERGATWRCDEKKETCGGDLINLGCLPAQIHQPRCKCKNKSEKKIFRCGIQRTEAWRSLLPKISFRPCLESMERAPTIFASGIPCRSTVPSAGVLQGPVGDWRCAACL